MAAMRAWATGILVAGLLPGCDQREAGGPESDREQAGKGDGWTSLVPGQGTGAWEVVDFGGEGEAVWEKGVLRMTQGASLTGVRWEGDLPEAPYEIRLEARKTLGDDFFCGLTVPVRGPEHCVTFIVGGWGGTTVGISSIGGLDASENETTTYHKFETGRWYAVRMVVREDRLEAWLDDQEVVAVDIGGREIGLRPGLIDLTAPLGLASFQTDAEIREVAWRALDGSG